MPEDKTRLGVYLTKALFDDVKRVAKAQGLSMSTVTVLALQNYIARFDYKNLLN